MSSYNCGKSYIDNAFSKRRFVESKFIKKTYRPIIIKEQFDKTTLFNIDEKMYYIRHKKRSIKKENIIINKDFARLLGVFLAEGHAKRYNNSSGNNNYVFTFSLHSDEKELIEFIINYFKQYGSLIVLLMLMEIHLLFMFIINYF